MASTLASLTGATRLKREILKGARAAVARALILSAALSLFFAACDEGPKLAVRAADGMFVMELGGLIHEYQLAT
jgi:hypothetical protein